MVIIEILSFIFVLVLLVFVHELGHFAVAKWCGIRVETFSLGFPPKMIGFRRGDTEYCLSWIPLGGYVKMAGEKPDAGEIKGAPYEFMSKPVWQRSLVIVAGPAMNYVLAIVLLFFVGFYQGEGVPDDTKAVIGTVVVGGPAASIDLQPKDVIVAVDDSTISSFREMFNLITSQPDKSITLTWLRGTDTLNSVVHTRADTTLNMQGEVTVIGRIGVSQDVAYRPVGFVQAWSMAFGDASRYAGMIFVFLKDIVTGSVSSRLIGGPLFIAQAAGEAARQGFLAVLLLAAILSVNLAVVNLMPIPVLDGGQLLFLAIEKIKGSPVSVKARAITQQIGLVFLIGLIIFVTKNDIWRINIFGW